MVIVYSLGSDRSNGTDMRSVAFRQLSPDCDCPLCHVTKAKGMATRNLYLSTRVDAAEYSNPPHLVLRANRSLLACPIMSEQAKRSLSSRFSKATNALASPRLYLPSYQSIRLKWIPVFNPQWYISSFSPVHDEYFIHSSAYFVQLIFQQDKSMEQEEKLFAAVEGPHKSG